MTLIASIAEGRNARLARLGMGPLRRAVRPMVLPLEKRAEPSPWDTPPVAPYDEYVAPVAAKKPPRWVASARAPLWRQILCEVANDHDIDPETILTRGKVRERVMARNDLCWRLRDRTTMSPIEIGKRIGLDDSTVRHAIRRHRAFLRGTA